MLIVMNKKTNTSRKRTMLLFIVFIAPPTLVYLNSAVSFAEVLFALTLLSAVGYVLWFASSPRS